MRIPQLFTDGLYLGSSHSERSLGNVESCELECLGHREIYRKRDCDPSRWWQEGQGLRVLEASLDYMRPFLFFF